MLPADHPSNHVVAPARPRSWMVAALVPIALMLAIRTSTAPFVGDDAYMTFRVARNVIEGHGFVCNPGENVLSTSTPAWAALTGLAAWAVGTDPASAFRPFSVLIESANLILLVGIASLWGAWPWRGLVAGALYALSWHANVSAHVGMETPLVVFVQLTTVAILLRDASLRSQALAGAVAGTAIIVRPEGALLPVALVAYLWLETRRPPWRALLAAGMVLAAFLLWLWASFGTIVPQAALAKSLAYHRAPGQALGAMGDHLVFFLFVPAFQRGLETGLLFAAVLVGLVALGLKAIAAAARPVFVLALNLVLVAGLFAVTNPLIFEWYVVAFEPFYAIVAAWGAARAATWGSGPWARALARPAAIAVTAGLLLAALLRYDLPAPRLACVDAPGGVHGWPLLAGVERTRVLTLGPRAREALYLQLAERFGPELGQGASVLAPEFGAFGYATRARMISSIGHVNPEVFAYLPTPRAAIGDHINNGITVAMVRGLAPDYVLSLETFIRRGPLQDPWFLSHYHLVARRESRVFGSNGLYLFRAGPPPGPTPGPPRSEATALSARFAPTR